MSVQNPGLQKTVNPPQVATGKALNLSQEAKASSDMAADFGRSVARGIGNFAGAVVQYKADKQNADDLLASNNAYNEYVKQLTDLNTRRNTQHGADAVEFKPRYNKEAEALHSNITHIMDSDSIIKNPKVREELRSKINSINTRNREESFLYFDREERALKKKANDEMLDNLANQAIDKFQNGGEATNNANLDDIFAQLEAGVRAQMESDGYHPVAEGTPDAARINEGINVMFSNQVMEKRKKILDSVGEHLNATNNDMRPWKETASAIALMEYARDHGYVDNQYALKKLKEYENKAYGVELMRHPDIYWDEKTGKFNSHLRKKYTKYLSQDEFERAAKTVRDGSNANPTAGAELGSFIVGLNNAALDDDKRWRRLHGFWTKQEIDDYTYDMSDDEKKAFQAELNAARKKTSPSEIIDRFITMKETQKAPVVYVPQLGKAVRVTEDGKVNEGDLNADQIKLVEDGLAQGAFNKYYPWNQNSEYNNAVLQYQRMADADLLNKGLEGTNKVVRRNGRWLFGDYKYRTRDMMYQNLWNAFMEEAKRSKDTGDLLKMIDTASLTQAAEQAINKARTGGWVFADASYANAVRVDKEGKPILDANGMKQPVRVFKPINIDISGDSLDAVNKADVAAITIEALRSSVAAERFNWLENTALMKEAKKAAQQDKSGMVRGTGNTFIDDTDTFVTGGYQPDGVLSRFGAREFDKALRGDVTGNKI